MELHSLTQYAEQYQGALPPVEQWNPKHCGDMNLVIKANGEWWHEGSPIRRDKLVRLFASILVREGDTYYLITPVEKVRITVEDRPLHIALLEREAGNLYALTRTGDRVCISQAHPLEVSAMKLPYGEERIPEVRIRRNLWARLSRNAFYQLVEWSNMHDGLETGPRAAVVSSGETFYID